MLEILDIIANKYNIPNDITNCINNILYISNLNFDEEVKYYGNTPILWKFFENKKSLNRLLFTAIKYKHYPLMWRAVYRGADISYMLEECIRDKRTNDINRLLKVAKRKKVSYFHALRAASEIGDLSLIYTFKNLNTDARFMSNIETIIDSAAYTGQLHIIKHFFKHGFDYSIALGLAAENGFLNIVEFFIERQGKKQERRNDIQRAIKYSLKGGYSNIYNKYIHKYNLYYDVLFVNAANGGLFEIMKNMTNQLEIEDGNFIQETLNKALHNAAISGHLQIVLYLVSLGANDFNDAMVVANHTNNIQIVKEMLNCGATDYNTCLYLATNFNNYEIFKLMLENGKGKCIFNLQLQLNAACTEGHLSLVKELISLSKDGTYYKNNKYDLNTSMYKASENGHIDVVLYLLSLGANNFNYSMKNASWGGHLDVIKEMISNGADDFESARVNAIRGNQPDIVEFYDELIRKNGANNKK